MIIHATKKALPLFSYLEQSEDINEAKLRSNQNPLDSWHANYFNVNRKKMLLLMNDASLYTILIPDVNATRKKDLETLIVEALANQLKVDGFKASLTQPYLDQLGQVEVATGYNRKVTSTSNHFIYMLEGYIYSEGQSIKASKLASWLNEVPVSSLKHISPIRELQAWLSGEEQVQPKEELSLEGKFIIDKKWDDFSLWEERSEKVNTNQLNPLRIENEYLSHSGYLIAGFTTYLEKEERLSEKVVRRHANNIQYFMDFLFRDAIYSPLRDGSDLMSYFYWLIDYGIVTSDNEFNRQITTLKKFYTFLFYMNVIDKEELADKKEDIKDAKEFVLEY